MSKRGDASIRAPAAWGFREVVGRHVQRSSRDDPNDPVQHERRREYAGSASLPVVETTRCRAIKHRHIPAEDGRRYIGINAGLFFPTWAAAAPLPNAAPGMNISWDGPDGKG